uniref:Uncharacterized protein n=1 Tax=Setaria digitata TaxID=48799 RepID=A0A915PK96_9BILA
MDETKQPVRKSTPPPPYSPERPPPPYSKMINIASVDLDLNEIKKEEDVNRKAPHLPCTPFSSGSVTSTVHPQQVLAPATVIGSSHGINPASGMLQEFWKVT